LSPATTSLSTLSLHDALPIFARRRERALFLVLGVPSAAGRGVPLVPGADLRRAVAVDARPGCARPRRGPARRSIGPAARDPRRGDRKSTRLNSSHQIISYAVF